MKGSCLCGNIEYEIDQLDAPIGHCHCQTCRKAHAAAFATTARVEHAHFRWTRGADKFSSYESSPGKLRHFCPTCGSQLAAERAGQSFMVVRVATLDEDPGARPQVHIWTSHNVPWLAYDDVPQYPEWQPGR